MEQAVQQSASRGVTVRSVLLGTVLIPPNAYWVMMVEGIYRRGHPSVMALPWNVLFNVLVLVIINQALKRYVPRFEGARAGKTWSCILIASILKWATLQWGGLRGYRQLLPVAFGIIIGEYMIGAMWSVIAVHKGQFIYDFSPG